MPATTLLADDLVDERRLPTTELEAALGVLVGPTRRYVLRRRAL